MPNTNPGAKAPDLTELQVTGRTLNTIGVAMLALAVASFLCATDMSAWTRLASGFSIASVVAITGQGALRFGAQGNWFGSMLIAGAYGLAYFFAIGVLDASGLPAMECPFWCWGVALVAAGAACLQTNKNRVLFLPGMLFTLAVSAHVLFLALNSKDTVQLFGVSASVSSVASVLGMLWWSALSAVYRHLGDKPAPNAVLPVAHKIANRVGHELCFILASLNALALPAYCSSMENAPLWWSLEVPVLLAICFRSGDFFKHALVMGIWITSAALTFIEGAKLSILVSMAVPLSGTIVAFAYRFVQSSWPKWQKLCCYSVYLYGSTAVALALTVVHFTMWEGLPYWLVASGAILALALVMHDRVMQAIGAFVAVGALVIFGIHWQEWNNALAIMVVGGCYGFSVAYGLIKKRGGWESSPFSLLPGSSMLSGKEAGLLEIAAAVFGYATLIAGSFLLVESPFNTVAWGIEAFVLIAFGFLTRRRGHRFSGLVALFLASGKLAIFDLSGIGGGWRIVASLGAVGVCFVAAGIFYLVEYGRTNRNNSNNP